MPELADGLGWQHFERDWSVVLGHLGRQFLSDGEFYGTVPIHGGWTVDLQRDIGFDSAGAILQPDLRNPNALRHGDAGRELYLRQRGTADGLLARRSAGRQFQLYTGCDGKADGIGGDAVERFGCAVGAERELRTGGRDAWDELSDEFGWRIPGEPGV